MKFCGGYIQEVKNAREDIIALQPAVTGLERVLQKLEKFLQGPKRSKLSTSQLFDDITNCLSVLRALEEKIDPRRGQKMMRRFGLQALMWPLNRTEVERVMQDLERHKSSFNLSLKVDQMYVFQL